MKIRRWIWEGTLPPERVATPPLKARSFQVRIEGFLRRLENGTDVRRKCNCSIIHQHGVDTVFGLPGVQIYSLFDALYEARDIKVIGSRHEQATAYMAFGYAKSTGNGGL